MPEVQREFVVGVDLGGTKIYAGVFNAKLECLGKAKVSTKSQRGPQAVISRIAQCVLSAVDECDLQPKQIRAVGIGAPGAVETEEGVVLYAPNLNWREIGLRKGLEKELDLPVYVENDCNIAMLGIYEAELRRKPRNLVGVFIGTGIGGGIILEGRPYHGFNRTAGELGHMILQVNGPKCSCGNNGCFEALAGRSGIFRKITAAVKAGQSTILTDMLGPELENLRSGDLRKAIRRGDKFVAQIVEDAAEYTGIALSNLINLLNPEVIVLGGGVVEALQEEMMPIVVKTALSYALTGTSTNIQILATKLGDNAGIVGGAVLALRQGESAAD